MTTTTRRFLGLLGVGAFAVALAPTIAHAQTKATGAKNRVVFQMSDSDPMKWNLALNNMRNLQVDLGDDAVELELVAYGPGIGMLKGDSPVAKRISEALKTGAKVVACENTMKGQKLVYVDMLPDIGYVPSGVVELMRKQQEGYAYIRP
jgi:intracellular sulfur oxidation DsrE/DsrF family protein